MDNFVAQLNNEPLQTKKYVFNQTPVVSKLPNQVLHESSNDAVVDYEVKDPQRMPSNVKVVKLDETMYFSPSVTPSQI